ncbi:hypothetical protein GSY71_01700 [Pusillimonas sp. TS35]|uniref:hypothetical protein n=1 Tax=Paracandidimonas lactea TaxID=2895524 RepID=UPI0014250E83|nr:hypothetical protein [Paracandidimonas lactea]MYN11867.1 hypothetical protein [Pusillimonas sp. TS35]
MQNSTFPRRPAAKWPFPARRAPARQSKLSRGAMLVDVCLVLAWGATIPGMMWLGVAGGF